MFNVLASLAGSKVVTEKLQAQDPGSKMLPVINLEQCIEDCDQCFKVCPTEALSKKGVDPLRCINCLRCQELCPVHCIGLTDIPIIENTPSLDQIGKTLKERVKKMCRGSLHIRYVNTGACNGCDFEINALSNPIYDIEQYGVNFVASPRHADLLLVTGVVTRNLEMALKKTYEACPHPTLVVAVGSCGCGGGIFKEAYAAGGGVDQYLPVDVYVPGCPPTPFLVIKGILKAIKKI